MNQRLFTLSLKWGMQVCLECGHRQHGETVCLYFLFMADKLLEMSSQFDMMCDTGLTITIVYFEQICQIEPENVIIDFFFKQ